MSYYLLHDRSQPNREGIARSWSKCQSLTLFSLPATGVGRIEAYLYDASIS
jgi:hypothetical protein